MEKDFFQTDHKFCFWMSHFWSVGFSLTGDLQQRDQNLFPLKPGKLPLTSAEDWPDVHNTARGGKT